MGVGGRVKGVAIREFVRWYGDNYGDDAVQTLAAALPTDFQALIDARAPYLGLIASEWYPATGIHVVLDKMVEGRPPAERARISREGAATVVRQNLSGVYKAFFDMMATPERYMRNAQKLFSRYFDTGVIEKQAVAPTEHQSLIRDWPSHHPMLCEFVLYIAEYVYGEMGCKDVQVERLRCVADGAAECAHRIRWSA